MKRRENPWDRFMREEYRDLKKLGLSYETIGWYYNNIALESIEDSIKYDVYNLPLFGQGDDKNHGCDLDHGIFFCRSWSLEITGGSSSSKSEQISSQDDIPWSSIKMCVYPIQTCDGRDAYIEQLEIAGREGYSKELKKMLDGLSECNKQIIAGIMNGMSQRQIARKLGVSDAAVSKRMVTIRKRLEPYRNKKLENG